VNFNKFLRNIIYCALAPDGHVYLKSTNPQFQYLDRIMLSAVFEDFEEAEGLQCESGEECTDTCDPMEKEFPIESYLVPALINQVVKQLLGSRYIPKDSSNDANDTLSDIYAFLKRNLKSDLTKQIEGGAD